MEASPTNNSTRLPPIGAGSKLLLVQPDAVLCKLCTRGSDDAFAVLHARYRQQVYAFVFHLLGRGANQPDVEDLTQDIFSKAFVAMRDRRESGSFKSWLFVIARNTTFDHIRARKPNSLALDEAAERADDNVVSLDAHIERRGQLAWLVAAMSELPERQREALVLRELGGMSYGEIAESLDTNPESVKQLIKRGRARVSVAAEASGYSSRRLGRDLAMAAPIAPLAAVGLGTSAAGAAVGGGSLVAMGGKIAATVAAVAVIGGGTAVVGEKVASGDDSQKPAQTIHNAPLTAQGTGWGVGQVPPGASVSDTAKRRAEEKRELRAEKRAAKREQAKLKKERAKAKRERAAKRRNMRANTNPNAGRGNNSGSAPQSSSGGSNSNSGKGGGNSGGTQNAAPQATQPAAPEKPANNGSGKGGGPKN